MTENRFPPGWDEERVRRVLEHYEQRSDEEAVAEDEERYDASRTGDGGYGRPSASDSRAHRKEQA